MKTFPSPSEFRFHAGPYVPPKLKKGQRVKDAWAGLVEVAGKTEAPIPWPAHLYLGKLMPIFTGDLLRAVIEESEGVVAHYWGVSKYHLDLWKQALAGVEGPDVFAALAVKKCDPKFRKRAGY